MDKRSVELVAGDVEGVVCSLEAVIMERSQNIERKSTIMFE
jgi:hypothetical protein